jgi:hypothetical protein
MIHFYFYALLLIIQCTANRKKYKDDILITSVHIPHTVVEIHQTKFQGPLHVEQYDDSVLL